MKIRNRFIIACCSVFLFACDNYDDHETYPDLQIYVGRFIEEAHSRGWDFDPSIIDAVYVDRINMNSTTFCGYGYSNYKDTGGRRIEISKSCNWINSPDADREVLAFHELGHAILNRTHDNIKDCNGEPISIMSQTFPTYKAAETEKRTYYIDELFDQLTAGNKCIDYGQDFKIDPRFYQYANNDADWYFYSSNNRYTGVQNQSPTITCTDITTTETGYWYRSFESPAIPNCAEVMLRVKMNSAGLTGKGAAIAIRVYENEITNAGATTKQTQFFTTEDEPISGVLDDRLAEVVVPCLTMKTTSIVVFGVMMPGTTGQVRFDDIQLLVKE
jgi:hypothetical protein